MENQCLQCGEVLIGRRDKKFCNDYCRSNYYNKIKGEENNYLRTVNNILRKNRRILVALNPKGKAKVKKETLLKKGFNFAYHTDTYTTKDQKIYTYCYEQGYLELEGDWYALVEKKEYLIDRN